MTLLLTCETGHIRAHTLALPLIVIAISSGLELAFPPDVVTVGASSVSLVPSLLSPVLPTGLTPFPGSGPLVRSVLLGLVLRPLVMRWARGLICTSGLPALLETFTVIGRLIDFSECDCHLIDCTALSSDIVPFNHLLNQAAWKSINESLLERELIRFRGESTGLLTELTDVAIDAV